MFSTTQQFAGIFGITNNHLVQHNALTSQHKPFTEMIDNLLIVATNK